MRMLFIMFALTVVVSLEALASNDTTVCAYYEEQKHMTKDQNGFALNKSDRLEELMDDAKNTSAPFLTVERKRKPTDEEYALMRLMLSDSIGLYYDYRMPNYLNEEDRELINSWREANKEVVDDMLIDDVIRLASIESRIDFIYCPIDFIGHKILNDNFAERLNWRRMVVDRRGPSDTNTLLDVWVESIRKDFGENQKDALPVKSIYLSFNNKRFIDTLNLVNGKIFIECDGFELDAPKFDKIKDWCWANKGIVSDELFSEVYNLLYNKDMKISTEAYYAKIEKGIKEKIKDLDVIVINGQH